MCNDSDWQIRMYMSLHSDDQSIGVRHLPGYDTAATVEVGALLQACYLHSVTKFPLDKCVRVSCWLRRCVGLASNFWGVAHGLVVFGIFWRRIADALLLVSPFLIRGGVTW